MKLYNLPFYGVTYRAIMKLAHRFNWHYAPPIYPEGDTMLLCKWCGFRDVIKRATDQDIRLPASDEAGEGR